MAKYIEQEPILNRLKKVKMDNSIPFNAGIQFGVDHAIECISQEPAVDVAPVVHGKWIRYDASYWRYNHSGAYPVNRIRFKCSVCGRTASRKEPYCHCGARMDL